MTRIRANCPDCGDVELAPAAMLVQVAHDASELVGDRSRYRFTCPTCDAMVTKPADDRIVQLLISGGVPMEVQAAEAVAPSVAASSSRKAHHPENPPGGRALSHDDLLDLHLLLRREDWFSQLVAAR